MSDEGQNTDETPTTGRITTVLGSRDSVRVALDVALEPSDSGATLMTAELRRLGSLAAANDAPPELLDSLAFQLTDIADQLQPYARTTRHRSSTRAGDLFLTHPVIGPLNPVAAPLVVRHEGDRVVAEATYPLSKEGAEGFVQGGFIAAAFDALLAMGAGINGRIGPTVSLEVRYLAPTPVGQVIHYEAEIESVDGRRTTVVGVARCGDVVTARASGVFKSLG